jgi:hypothetical protein
MAWSMMMMMTVVPKTLNNSLKPLNQKEGISNIIKRTASFESCHAVREFLSLQEQVLIRHVIKLVKSRDSSVGIAAGCR